VQGLHVSRLVSGWILPVIRGPRPSKPTNAQGLCITLRATMHKGCALATGGLGSRNHAVPQGIPRVPSHAFPAKTGLPTPNVIMLKGRALATLSPRVARIGPRVARIGPRVARIGPRVAKFDAEVAKMSRGVAKSAPFRVNLATWLATLEAAVKSSERVWWYLTNFLSLNCPESARRNAPPQVATMQLTDHGREPLSDNGLAAVGLL